MSAAFVQKGLTASPTSNTIASFTITAPSNLTGGNSVVGSAIYFGSGATSGDITGGSISDGTNSYTLIDWYIDANNEIIFTFWGTNITSPGTGTITVTFAPSIDRGYAVGCFHEVSGLNTATLNQHTYASTFNAASSPVSSGNVTTTANGCYVYGALTASYNVTTISAGTGFTLETNYSNGSIGQLADEYQVQGSSGAIGATFNVQTGANYDYDVALVALAPGGSGGPSFFNRRLTGFGEFVKVGSLWWASDKLIKNPEVTRRELLTLGIKHLR